MYSPLDIPTSPPSETPNWGLLKEKSISLASVSPPGLYTQPFTDYTRWRLVVNDGGRHTWKYLDTDEECKEWEQNEVDRYWLGLDLNLPTLPKPSTPLEAARNGFEFYKHLQSHDGHWAGEYGGPMFLLPGLVIGSYVTGMEFTTEERLEMARYLFNRANPDDGGWGIHIEGHSTVFGTALNYAALRILGVDKDHPVCVKARRCLHGLGGATGIPAWGKFWLSVLGVYDWDGVNPVPPELWLLPPSLPIHPHRWWIHTRTVYIPMSYIYATRFTHPLDNLTKSLRSELYPPTQPYSSIHWPSQRNNICPADLYSPHTTLLDVLNFGLGKVEGVVMSALGKSMGCGWVRRKALEKAYELIVWEDENTGYQTLGPVSKMMNLIVRAVACDTKTYPPSEYPRVWSEHDVPLPPSSSPSSSSAASLTTSKPRPRSHAYNMHEKRRQDFMWLGREGMMMCGTNGSQLWDLGFIAQAVVETGLVGERGNEESVRGMLRWLDDAQMQDDPVRGVGREGGWRHGTRGAWGFSTKEQGYTVSDCTGEGLKAVLYLQDSLPTQIAPQRLYDAVDTMLSLQNPNGGFASYELVRGPRWLEMINPAEVFGDIMIEYCYPECTTSVITALSIFRKRYPDYRVDDIQQTISKAITYLHAAQHPNGAWVGSWGICFTYATQFALESLSLVGETYGNSGVVKKACEFLVRMQRGDGGWGESYKSCESSTWIEHEHSQVVQTCWAVLALMYANYPHAEPIERGVKLVMERQLPDGSWPQESIEGVFNKNCAISYPNFKFSFPIWMLGRADRYLRELKGV